MVMMNKFDLYVGHFEQQEDTTHVISLWHIPNSTGYDKAHVINLFCSDEKLAREWVAKWDASPEMPILMTLEEYLENKAKTDERISAQKVERYPSYDYHDGYAAATLV